jgi:ribulose-phosphate 3-epimerase
MAEILPVVNCGDLRSLTDRLKAIEAITPEDSWVHLDIADGRFTFHKTWNDPSAWPKLNQRRRAEVHLMVEEPEKEVEGWLAAGAKRIIVHYEAIFLPKYRSRTAAAEGPKLLAWIRRQCDAHHAELMLSHNPETTPEKLVYHSEGIRAFQVLSVNPGLAGQAFLPVALPKIEFLRRNFRDATIEVDGGITPETLARAQAAGANLFTSDSYIFHHADPGHAYRQLSEL